MKIVSLSIWIELRKSSHFPRSWISQIGGGGANLKGGGANLLFMSTFSKKLHEIGGKIDREGGHVSLPLPPLDPPMTFCISQVLA